MDLAGATQDFPDYSQELGRLTPDGLDVSEGQWQKLAIARAIFEKRKFFIFDEPTASPDAQAENNLYQMLHDRLSDRGCIFISHRLPSAIMADRIIVLDGKTIAEVGTHSELLERQGIYASMYYVQSSSYVSENQKEGYVWDA